MKTSQEIRLENLRALLVEAGSAAALARLSEVPPPYISQLLNGVKNDSGEIRKMGDDTARKLERGMSKAKGWIDADHAMPTADLESEVIAILRELTPERRAAVLDSVRGVFHGQKEASAAPPPPTPPPTKPTGLARLKRRGGSPLDRVATAKKATKKKGT